MFVIGISARTVYAAGAETLALTVEQVFTTSSAAVDDTFRYRLVALNSGNPMPAGSTAAGYEFTISGSQSVNTGLITYVNAGLYRYTLGQVVTAARSGYSYDDEVYTIEVRVSNDGSGGLQASVVIYEQGGFKADHIDFENSYQADDVNPTPTPTPTPTPGPTPTPTPTTGPTPTPTPSPSPTPSPGPSSTQRPGGNPGSGGNNPSPTSTPKGVLSDPSLMLDPPVRKVVFGNPKRDAKFTFQLKAQNPAQPMPAGSENGVKTLTIKGSGEEEFGTWAYTEAGTYFYTVSEVNTGEEGYTYDAMVYTITDTVRVSDGRLIVDRELSKNSDQQADVFLFINRYSAEEAPLVDGGTGSAPGAEEPPDVGPGVAVGPDGISIGFDGVATGSPDYIGTDDSDANWVDNGRDPNYLGDPNAPAGVPGTPRTGDPANVVLYLLISFGIGCVLAAYALYSRINKNRKKLSPEGSD